MDSLAKKLKLVRELRGKTLLKLSEETGVSFAYLHQLESRKRSNPSLAVLKKIAAALRVELSYLVEEDAKTPFDFFSDLDDDIREFLLNQENLPWFELSKEAKESGATPEMLQEFLTWLKTLTHKQQ
jgi:transcriptional regulator with XRE-family HTH domain